MNKITGRLLEVSRNIYLKLEDREKSSESEKNNILLRGQYASDFIKGRLEDPYPLMITRFGGDIISATLVYFYKNNLTAIQRIKKYLQGKITKFWWDEGIRKTVTRNAGVFPNDIQTLERFAQKMLIDIGEIDILGSYYPFEENILKEKYFHNAVVLKARDLEPYYHENPWSEVLENKKVLVIHPFAQTITKQYNERLLLFNNKKILPTFELKTIKAVQSIAYNETGFSSWFEALDFMCEQADNVDFDIALIGCGAYGLPLAAHIKRKGKKAIHIGGAIQLLFGIIGKRWENEKAYPEIFSLFNRNWVRPHKSEIPLNSNQIEEGCYW